MKYETLELKGIVDKRSIDRIGDKQKAGQPITEADAPTNGEITEGKEKEKLTRRERIRIKLKAAGGMIVKGLIATAAIVGLVTLFRPEIAISAMVLTAANAGQVADAACKLISALKDGATALFTKTKAALGARWDNWNL